MTQEQMEEARRLFPDKRPRWARYRSFYSKRQLQWLSDNFPTNPARQIAEVMREEETDVVQFARRSGLRHTREYKAGVFRQNAKEYRRQELFRIRYGLARKGRMYLTMKPYTGGQGMARYRAKMKGYIPGNPLDETERWFIYYDKDTRRSKRMESSITGRHRLWVQPLPEWKVNLKDN